MYTPGRPPNCLCVDYRHQLRNLRTADQSLQDALQEVNAQTPIVVGWDTFDGFANRTVLEDLPPRGFDRL